MRLAALVLPLTLLGCGPSAGGSDTGTENADGNDGFADLTDGTDGTSGASDGTDGSDGTTSSDAPVVTAGDAWCYEHSTGDVVFLWKVELAFSDPQGLDTINTFFDDGVVVEQGGAEVARYALTCSAADGTCSGGFNEAANGVSCANASSYTLQIQVVDEDGNWSAPLSLPGRQGTGPTG